MKAQTKALVASVVVIALALTAVSGITYSWFSDTETSTIDVTTAKIDIDGAYQDSVSVTGFSGSSVSDTTATISADKKNLEISNLLSHRTIKATYDLTNKSTVDTTYRMYVSVDGITDDLANLMIEVSGTIGSETATLPLSFTNGIAYVFGSDTHGVSLVKSSSGSYDTYSLLLTIDSSDLTSSVSSFQIKIVNEAYQSDYAYTAAKVLSKTGTASIPAIVATGDMTFKGIVPADTGASNAKSAEADITFSKGALNSATGNGAKSVILKTEMLEPSGSVAKISLKLDNAASSNFGTNYVTVSLSIPGNYTGLDVEYTGTTGGDPIVLGCNYDSTKDVTIVTFKTNHFSEFVVVGNDKSSANVSDSDSLITALGAGIKTVTLMEDVDLASAAIVTGDTILNMNKKTISNTKDIYDDWTSLIQVKGGNLTVTGNGNILAKQDDCYTFTIRSGTLTIEDGTFKGNVSCIYLFPGYCEDGVRDKYVNPNGDKAVLNILGGSFYEIQRTYGTKYMINQFDYAREYCSVNITGGLFVGYDPSHSGGENPEANYLVEGYVATKTISDGTEAYVVSKAPIKVTQGSMSSYFSDLDGAVKYIKGLTSDGDITVSVRTSGEYVWKENHIDGSYTGDVIFTTEEGVDASFDMTQVPSSGSDRNAIYVEGKNLKFNGIDFIYPFADYRSFARPGTLEYEDCTFTGKYCTTGSAVFNNCIFNSNGEYNYLVQVYSGTASFQKCTFNSSGKAVLVYSESGELEANFDNCTFMDDNGMKEKAAIEIHTEYGQAPDNISCTITIKNCTVSGFEAGRFSDSNLWSAVNNINEPTNSGTTTVTVDGVVKLQPTASA